MAPLAPGVLVAAVLSGCFGDPPPDPADAPLEVVLDGCRLNRPSVQAGTHALAVVGQGRVTVTDPSGRVVLTTRGGEGDVPAELAMTEGTYAMACEPDGGRLGEAELVVDPTE